MKCFLLTALFCIEFIFLFSQNNIEHFKRCPVKTINYEQGLSNNATTNIITDALGFTWVSTQTCMQRYNGYALETVNPVIDKKIISINSPVSFFSLQNGLIWISYRKGVLEYNPYTNAFRKIIETALTTNLNFSLIPVKQTSEGIFCLENNAGIVLYSVKGQFSKRFSLKEDEFVQNVFNHQNILNNAIYTTNQNSVFIYNSNNYIKQFDFATHKTSFFVVDNFISFTCSDKFIYTISNSNIKAINIYNKTVEKNIPLTNILNEKITNAAAYVSSKNRLFIGLNSHLIEFDTAGNFKNEFTDLNRNPVVAVGFIRTVYTDKFRRIWLLTNDDIKRIQNFNIPFEHFIYPNEKNNFIRSIYYDEKKHLLIAGCYNGGIQLYDSLGNTLWKKAIASANVQDINAIEKLTDDNYLIETIGKGWYVLNLPLKKTEPFLLNDSIENKIHSHNINFINNVQRINDSSCFIATQFNVLNCVFKKEKLKSAQLLLPFNNGVAPDEISCFIYTSNKTLWAGTITGIVYRLDENKHLETIRIPENYQVRTFAEDAQHNIWIGTDKGLYVYNSSGIPIKNFTTQTGLLNDCIYALLPVNNKAAVFASSNLGLSYVSLNENIINYTKESGLQENEFNTESAIKTKAGKYFFGGVNGITAFYPSSLFNIKDKPLLNIIKLTVNDSVYNGYSSVWKNDSIILRYNQNHIQLSFAAIGLLNTDEYVYKYRLKGLETNWQTTHEPTGIKYVLQPAKYTLEITCHPIFSTGNNTIKSFYIIVQPPWWQTWWFKILVTVAVIATIIFIVRRYHRGKYEQKIHALELQQNIQRERERISRDLHDNLGAYAAAIAANVSSLQNYHDNNTTVINHLKSNSQSIINQLNDTIWALNKEFISLTAISDRFKLFLQKIKPNYADINIEIKEEIITESTLSPANALHLFRIMQEAVNNALKHSNCKNIMIELISRNTWQVIIKDDGNGFENLKEKFAGNGLKNMQLRSTEAGWNIHWKDAAPNGTEIIISPLL